MFYLGMLSSLCFDQCKQFFICFILIEEFVVPGGTACEAALTLTALFIFPSRWSLPRT